MAVPVLFCAFGLLGSQSNAQVNLKHLRTNRIYLRAGEANAFWMSRPTRMLSKTEANTWLNTAKASPEPTAAVDFGLDRQGLFAAATADVVRLKSMITDRKSEFRGAAIREAVLRKERSFIGLLRLQSFDGDLSAMRAWIGIDPINATTILRDVFVKAPQASKAKDDAACELLKLGDVRGAATIRDAMKHNRAFGHHTGAGWKSDEKVCYLLIVFADKSNRRLIAEDLKTADVHIRYKFPELAKLHRAAVDAELLKLASDKYHGIRKWVAIAAKERLDSPDYVSALEKLSQDPVKDVSSTALWVLGRGPKPNNLGGLISH